MLIVAIFKKGPVDCRDRCLGLVQWNKVPEKSDVLEQPTLLECAPYGVLSGSESSIEMIGSDLQCVVRREAAPVARRPTCSCVMFFVNAVGGK